MTLINFEKLKKLLIKDKNTLGFIPKPSYKLEIFYSPVKCVFYNKKEKLIRVVYNGGDFTIYRSDYEMNVSLIKKEVIL